jgi:hypothetical protein
MNVVEKKKKKKDWGWRRCEWSKLHVVGAYTHKQKNLNCFFGTLNRPNPYSCTKTRHPIILFNSYFWSAENIGQQNFLLTFTSLLHRASYQVKLRQLTKIPTTMSQKQETLMGRASPTQWHGSCKPMHVRFWSLQSHLGVLRGRESNWSSLTFKC